MFLGYMHSLSWMMDYLTQTLYIDLFPQRFFGIVFPHIALKYLIPILRTEDVKDFKGPNEGALDRSLPHWFDFQRKTVISSPDNHKTCPPLSPQNI